MVLEADFLLLGSAGFVKRELSGGMPFSFMFFAIVGGVLLPVQRCVVGEEGMGWWGVGSYLDFLVYRADSLSPNTLLSCT